MVHSTTVVIGKFCNAVFGISNASYLTAGGVGDRGRVALWVGHVCEIGIAIIIKGRLFLIEVSDAQQEIVVEIITISNGAIDRIGDRRNLVIRSMIERDCTVLGINDLEEISMIIPVGVDKIAIFVIIKDECSVGIEYPLFTRVVEGHRIGLTTVVIGHRGIDGTSIIKASLAI